MDQHRREAYRVLGLAPGAEAGEVRRAFRRLARAHHPDRPGGSAPRFRLILAAYQRLKEEEAGPTRGRDLCLSLRLDLEDLARGQTLAVRYQREEPCPACRPRPRDDCPVCGGSGLVPGQGEVTLSLPAGLEAGTLLRLPGQGPYPPPPAHLPGDLFLRVQIKPHPLFRPRGPDLHLWWDPLTWPSGRPAVVPTLEGEVRLITTPRPGQIIRLCGQGLPRFNPPGRGDLLVHY